jgi:hypothetical protein
MSNGFGFQGGGGGTTTPAVESVTGLNTDNTDPLNPVVEISVDGTTITGDGTPANPLVATPSTSVTSVTGTAPIVSSGGTTPAISIPQASSSVNGYLRSTDFNTFNGKQATLVSGTNIRTINNTTLLASGNLDVQSVLTSGSNIRTINNSSVLGSGNISVQPTLVSGSNIRTINSTTLLGSGDIAVQPPLVSGTNIKTINGNSLLGSGNIVAGGNSSQQIEASIGQYVSAGGFTNTLLYSSPTPIISNTLGQVIDIDCLVMNQIFGTVQTIRFYINTTPTLTGASQFANYQYTPSVTNQMYRYFRRFIVSRNNSTLNWYLRSMDPYITNNDFIASGTNSVYNEYPLGFNTSQIGTYILITLNGAAELLAVTIDY